MVVISMAGMQTHRTELGTVVVPTYPRHSVALVQQPRTAWVASNGRLVTTRRSPKGGFAMPRYGFAENVRRYAVKEIEQARSRRAAFIALQAGATREKIRQASGEKDESDTLDICQVLRTRKFAHEAGVELIDDSGGQRLDTTFRFRILY